jgi:cytochrome c-type biogenesis protein CcmF
MIGQILIHLLFACAIVSTALYFLALQGRDHLRALARICFQFMAGGIGLAFILVMIQVFQHNFQYTYVWSYSSRELQPWYLFAASYAGQEGSFMLWTMWVAGIGVILLPFVRRRGWEAQIMVFYSLILVFLLLLLVVKNPFAFVWETFAKDGIADGFRPENGKGLNPLLHNVWITIHPPILFTGFAAMSVPFAFAMAALLRREYQSWIKIALPWTLYATAILGFGIMLGGFWAYETLGWGGYWAWDPVENSSLIPWLVSAALVHTMLIQKKTGGLVKTNIILAVLAFVLVLYSTFLTRSGVLGDTSVHSFVDPGMFAYILLISFMSTFIALGAGLIIYRRKDLSLARADFNPASREFLLSMGSASLLGSAIIVFIGTSWPLFADILHQPKVAIDPSFYNKTHLPLVILIMLLNAVSLLARWRSGSFAHFIKAGAFSALLAAAATGTSVWLGVHDALYILLTFGAWFALCINAELALKVIRARFSSAGAYISHVGIAMLMIGIVWTSRYSVTQHVRLVQGKTVNVMGYNLTFTGREQIEKEYKDREKYRFHITVEKDGKQDRVSPILFWSDFNKRQSAFLEPGISWSWGRDLYVSPKATDTEGGIPEITMSKEQITPFPTDSALRMQFIRFDMSNMAGGPSANGSIRPGIVVRIFGPNGDTVEHTLYSTLSMRTMESVPEPWTIPGTTQQIAFAKLLPNKESLAQSQAIISFTDTSKPTPAVKEVFTVEVSIKPLINLVWLGVIGMVAGFFISIARHRREIGAEQFRRPAPIENVPQDNEQQNADI